MKLYNKLIYIILISCCLTQISFTASSTTTSTKTGISGEYKPIVWGFSQFQGTEPRLEDRTIVNEDLGLYAVLDGHGGTDVVEEAISAIPESVKRYSKTKPSLVWPNIIADSDAKIRKAKRGSIFHKKLIEGGTTFVGAIIKGNIATIANLGDSRALLIRNSNVVAITDAHTPTNPEEKDRIESAGGLIQDGKLIGIRSISNAPDALTVSRSLGDAPFKMPATVLGDWSSAHPAIIEWPLEKGDIIVLVTNYTIEDSELALAVHNELSGASNDAQSYLLENECRTSHNNEKSGQRVEQGTDNTAIAIARAIRNVIIAKQNSNESPILNTTAMVIMYQ